MEPVPLSSIFFPGVGEEVAAKDTTVETVERWERVRQIEEALKTLPQQQQQILDLQYGFREPPIDNQEIAIRMRLDVKTVAKLSRQGRKNLRKNQLIRALYA